MNAHDHRTSDRHCIFRAAGGTFAVSAMSVREIAERPSMVSVPDAPAALAGLCHFRNEFMPVLNLRHMVGASSMEGDREGFLIVLSGHEGSWALLADRGLALEPLEIAYSAPGEELQIVTGTASFRDEVVQVLDADALYGRAAAMLEGNWRAEVREQRSEAGSQRPEAVKQP